MVKVVFQQLAKDMNIESVWLSDKTLISILNLGLVRTIFPQACFLHNVRDPAYAIDAIVRMEQHGGAGEAATRWRNWIIAWQEFEKRLPARLRYEVKYEDLVGDVPGVLEVLTGSFDLPARKNKLSVADRLGDVGVRPHHSNALEPVRLGEIGKGRARLSDEQRRVACPVVNDFVGSYGYDLI